MTSLGDVMVTRGGSLHPSTFPDEEFELYSIPAHDRGGPEIALGSEIGSSKQIVQPGDVMISKIIPHIRRARVVGPFRGKRQIASGEWIVFRGTSFDPNYLRHFLLSDGFHGQFMNTVAGVGGSLVRARPAQVKAIALPLPPLPEQRRIGAILDHADALRAKRRQVLTHLDSLTQSLFRDTSASGDYPQVALGDVTECLDSRRVPVTAADRPTGTVPYYGANGRQGWIDRPIFNEPLVLVAEDGGHFDDPQRGVAYRIDGPSWVNNHAHVLRPGPSIDIEFLHRALRHYNFRPYISGSTRSKLNQKQLKAATIALPPLKVQQGFANAVAKVDSTRAEVHQAITESDYLVASLQSQAFRGEL